MLPNTLKKIIKPCQVSRAFFWVNPLNKYEDRQSRKKDRKRPRDTKETGNTKKNGIIEKNGKNGKNGIVEKILDFRNNK